MKELDTTNRRLQGEVQQAKTLLNEQRAVITTLGQLVNEMMQTLSHYETLLNDAAQTIQAGEARIEELKKTQSGAP